MHAHLRTVEMLRPAGTVGCAAGLRASTFYQMCNSGWRKLENPLYGLTLVDLPFPSTHILLLVVARGEICHCHPDTTLEISSSCRSPSVLLGNYLK